MKNLVCFNIKNVKKILKKGIFPFVKIKKKIKFHKKIKD